MCSQVSWKATSRKILLRHGRIFCLCPAHALQAILHQQKRSREALCVARSPERPLAAKSYCATVGFFACALLTPYKPSFTNREEAGKRVLCSQVSWKATSPKILLRHGRIFCLCTAHALQATPHHRKVAGKRVLCSQVSPRPTSAKILPWRCALLTPYKPSLGTEKKPGSPFCAAKPVQKPTAAKSYYGAVGISLARLACDTLCPFLQAPPSYSRGPIASWMRRWALAFNPGL